MATPITYCTVEGCTTRVQGNGLCSMHYQRMRRHGSTDERPRTGRPPVNHPPCIVEGCTRGESDPHRVHGLCRFHYRQQWFKDNYVPVPRRAAEDRFWEKVDRRGPDDCWEWQASKVNGYGAFMAKANGKWSSHVAHRIAYELMIGPVPDGAHLHHTCGNRGCVNPAHLEPIMPSDHTIKTWVESLRSLGYTVTEPDAH